MRILSLLMLLTAAGCGSDPDQTAGTRLYFTSFQSGSLHSLDLEAETIVARTDLEDGAGTIGIAAPASGDTVFVVDGNSQSRLRILNAANLSAREELRFDGRVLVLGPGPVIHLTENGEQLVVFTRDYTQFRDGLSVFAVGQGSMQERTEAQLPCRLPALASTRGRLFAACSRRVVDVTRWIEGATEDATEVPDTDIPIEDVAGIAAFPSGDLFVLGTVEPDGTWLLVQLDPDGSTQQWDLASLLLPEPQPPGSGSRLLASHDGRMLGIFHGSQVWLVESDGLDVVQRADLPSPVLAILFAPDDDELVALRVDPSAREIVLSRMSVADGTVRDIGTGITVEAAGPIVAAVTSIP